MSQWATIFYQSGIRKGSRSFAEYEAAKRIINRFYLQPRIYELAISEAAKYVGL